MVPIWNYLLASAGRVGINGEIRLTDLKPWPDAAEIWATLYESWVPPGFTLIDLQPDHIDYIRFRDMDERTYGAIQNFRSFTKQFQGPGWTFTFEDNVLAVFGFFPMWDGVAEGWMIGDIQLPDYGRIFLRGARQFMDWIGPRSHLHRIQFTVHAPNVHAYRFAKTLYFSSEGVLHKYAPDQTDFFMMARNYP